MQKLTHHPEHQTRLRSELRSHLPRDTDTRTYSQIDSLPFLNALILEALRVQVSPPKGNLFPEQYPQAIHSQARDTYPFQCRPTFTNHKPHLYQACTLSNILLLPLATIANIIPLPC